MTIFRILSLSIPFQWVLSVVFPPDPVIQKFKKQKTKQNKTKKQKKLLN